MDKAATDANSMPERLKRTKANDAGVEDPAPASDSVTRLHLAQKCEDPIHSRITPMNSSGSNVRREAYIPPASRTSTQADVHRDGCYSVGATAAPQSYLYDTTSSHLHPARAFFNEVLCHTGSDSSHASVAKSSFGGSPTSAAAEGSENSSNDTPAYTGGLTK